jgi:predicted N-acetyltransferase YhbS
LEPQLTKVFARNYLSPLQVTFTTQKGKVLTMTRLNFMAQNLMNQPVTKQALIEQGVIGQRTTGIFIRDARPGDHAAIRDLTLAAYQEYAKPLGAYWEGYKAGILQTLEHVKPAEQIVVDDNGEIVAAILLYPAGTMFTAPNGDQLAAEFPEMRLLAVSPEKRGRGLATLLMRECVERAKALGAKTVMFHTTALMRALPLYQRVGKFVRTAQFDFWLAPGVMLECYRLALEGK